MVWLRIYITVVLLFLFLYIVFFNQERNIRKSLEKQIDALLFWFDKTVYNSRHVIFDYEGTQDILFHNQNVFFQAGKEYREMLLPLIEDVVYIGKLTNKQILQDDEIQTLKDTSLVWKNVYNLKKYTHIILTIMTLGIAKLFLP